MSAKNDGVVGLSEGPSYAGVKGTSPQGFGVYGVGAGESLIPQPATGCGVYGDSGRGPGVVGTSSSAAGVRGESSASGNSGVHGINNGAWPCTAVEADSANGHGVHGMNGTGADVPPTAGCGVWGESEVGIGVFGASKSGTAGVFVGGVTVEGGLQVAQALTAGTAKVIGQATFDNEVTVAGPASFALDVKVAGAVEVTGNLRVAADIFLTGADCAEQFDQQGSEPAEPGTVMVIDDDGALKPCDRSYDRRVAGVVSGAGAFRPAIVLDKRTAEGMRVPVALMGKAYCKVDADRGAIRVGDLLTTSGTTGHAMKVTGTSEGFGCVIGKALAPLESGSGLVPILITLQ